MMAVMPRHSLSTTIKHKKHNKQLRIQINPLKSDLPYHTTLFIEHFNKETMAHQSAHTYDTFSQNEKIKCTERQIYIRSDK